MKRMGKIRAILGNLGYNAILDSDLPEPFSSEIGDVGAIANGESAIGFKFWTEDRCLDIFERLTNGLAAGFF
jgi:hypothetical protein